MPIGSRAATSDSTASRAIGYAQALAVLRGESSAEEGLADTVEVRVAAPDTRAVAVGRALH